MNTRILGIDLGVTAQHKAVIYDPATAQYVGRPFSFRALPHEMDQLLARARSGTEQEPHLVALLEATGMAWYPVGTYLHHQGVTVYRVNGRQTRDLRHVLWRHAGSDQIDSRILTQLYALTKKQLVQWIPPTGEHLALQRACRAFDRFRQQDVAIRNRINSYHQWAWGGLKNLVPTAARTWMITHWYDPWQVQAAGVATLQQAWQEAAATRKRQDAVGTEWIPRWVTRARHMTKLYGSQQYVGYEALQSDIFDNWHLRRFYLEQQQRLSQERIQPLYRQLYPDCPLETIPGVGADSAATYMAFIQDIGRFRTVAQFRQWTGMVPSSKQSGEAQSKGLRMTQAGPNLIKATLYLNANVMRQWDVQLAAIYYKQMVDYGKHHTQAVCAAASHLASRIYVILSQQRPFHLLDEQNLPIDKLAARKRVLSAYQVPDEVRQRNNKRARKARKEQRIERRFARHNRH